MRRISTSTLSNQNITSALNVATYTADADREVFFRVFLDQVAGNGVYTAYITIQRAGTGSAFEVQPRTAPTVASGITSIAFTTVAIPVLNTDVVKVYVVGLAGDTTTPDIITEVWEADYLQPITDGQHAVNVDSSGKLLLQDGAVTAAVVGTGAIDADALAANTITAEKIASDAITAAKIAAGAITAAKFAAGAIDAAAVADGAIDAGAIANDAITAAKVATGTIDADALAVDAIVELVTALLTTIITGGTVQSALERANAYLDDEITSRAAPGDQMALVDNAITASKIASGAIDDDALAADTDVYQAKVELFDDDGNSTDRYVVIWFKNGAPVTTGITAPTIQIIKVGDGSNLIASTALTEIGALGLYRHTASLAERITSGFGYIARVTATIDGASRTSYQPIGRDTSS
jgi:hypothetical protein